MMGTKGNKKHFINIDDRFSKLVVKRVLGRVTNGRDNYFECLCDCGNLCNVSTYNLVHGAVTSCRRDLCRINGSIWSRKCGGIKRYIGLSRDNIKRIEQYKVISGKTRDEIINDALLLYLDRS